MIVELLPRLRRFARALTRNMSDADDLAQSAVERALLRHRGFEPGTRFDAWMFRIARNLWIDHLRREAVRGVRAELDDEALGADGRDTVENRLAANSAVAAMVALPEGQREVAALVLVEGFTYQETADALEIPVGTVMSRLSRARAALADAILGPEERAGKAAGGET